MADLTAVQEVVTEIQAGADTVLEVIESVDPAVDVPAATAQQITDVLGGLVTAALKGIAAAQGQPVTVESLQALMPNPAPLDPPTA